MLIDGPIIGKYLRTSISVEGSGAKPVDRFFSAIDAEVGTLLAITTIAGTKAISAIGSKIGSFYQLDIDDAAVSGCLVFGRRCGDEFNLCL
ncbi:MAG: hypothetical protein AAF242_03720 [Bacteroidota bacterium]